MFEVAEHKIIVYGRGGVSLDSMDRIIKYLPNEWKFNDVLI